MRFVEIKSGNTEISYTFRTSNFGSARGGAGVSDKGFASMDAGIEPTWMYSRRPLAGHPGAEF